MFFNKKYRKADSAKSWEMWKELFGNCKDLRINT